jgi:4-amino-4-deoxy-L-arabinose transferase-like glycosyltransferase
VKSSISKKILKMDNLDALERNASGKPELVEVPQKSHRSLPWCPILLGLAALNCAFQVVWFWRYTSRNINYDAISYIGIARHIADGDFNASLHGYWSPLISWCIAGASVFSNNFLLAGRVVTIISFLSCLPLLYLLTLRLWSSSTLAALSVLCFTLSRGVAAFSVSFIGADFLLTAAVLSYFILLLRCLRNPRPIHWLILGIAHGVAFLAKAFAMPLLACATVLAVFLTHKRSLKRMVIFTAAAMAIPLLVWGGWGVLLKTKYGQFTAGYQAKYNLLASDSKKSADRGELTILEDTSKNYDRYMVVDDMYPGSPLWNEHLSARKAISQILHKELKNLPEAFKQIVILITPGGVLAFLLLFRWMDWRRPRPEVILALIAALTSVLLIAGYCMLVFDGRYVLPLAPLLIAFGVPFLLPRFTVPGNRSLRILAGSLFAVSVIFFAFYRASPFRSLHRDFQTSVYSTAAELRQLPSCNRLVVIGEGPFPEHGVGWETGIYASYFAQCHVIGFGEKISSGKTIAVLADLRTLQPDSILLFGKSQNINYEFLLRTIQEEGSYSASKPLVDPGVGEIGRLLSKR